MKKLLIKDFLYKNWLTMIWIIGLVATIYILIHSIHDIVNLILE